MRFLTTSRLPESFTTPESRSRSIRGLVSSAATRWPVRTRRYRSSRLARSASLCSSRSRTNSSLASFFRVSSIRESACQGNGLHLGEIGELDAPANVEGGQPRVPDQVGRRGHSQQAEGQPLELRVLGSLVVTLPDAGEELVRGERQTP